jgi:hypothetical protein
MAVRTAKTAAFFFGEGKRDIMIEDLRVTRLTRGQYPRGVPSGPRRRRGISFE